MKKVKGLTKRLAAMFLSGLLLGGMDPVTAVCMFVVVVIAGLTVSMLSVVLILLLADRKAFNRQGQLGDIFE